MTGVPAASKPLNYLDWETGRASNRQRKSPQWGSVRQRYNYYKLYVYWWAEHFGDGLTLGLMFQAIYSPQLAPMLLACNPFLRLAREALMYGEAYYCPVVIGPDHGWSDND